ncbi:uncharacterized protein [Prorops nasuta]|uniref:uncharacterized protein isoform X2 n=1 Tax=Prorops nasuta TaxID=863751 RepID=UPI0034CD37AF
MEEKSLKTSNSFQDYFRIEACMNESNNDVESRLYAEIYYTSDNQNLEMETSIFVDTSEGCPDINEKEKEECNIWEGTSDITLKSKDNHNMEKNILNLDLSKESDSDESILEVPISPKPKPPIISLNDSDEDLASSVSENKKIENKEKDNSNTFVKPSAPELNIAINKCLINTNSNLSGTKDLSNIILNCTNIQKGAKSIKDIRNMSKNFVSDIDNIDKDINVSECNKNVHLNVMCKDKVGNMGKTVEKRKAENDLETINKKAKVSTVSKTLDKEQLRSNQYDNDEWANYFFKPMSEIVRAFYNNSRGQENFDVKQIQSQMSRDPRLWAVLDKDLVSTNRKRPRFFNVTCTNCQHIGHAQYDCPKPQKPLCCHMCGIQGHTVDKCPQKMCLTCGKKQSIFRKTCESCRKWHCSMCNSPGHNKSICPDLWRRYHQTVNSIEVNIPTNTSNVMKPAHLLFCCNCSKRGHESSACKDYRWSQHYPTPASVTNYSEGPTYIDYESTKTVVNSSPKVLIISDSPNETVAIKPLDNIPIDVYPTENKTLFYSSNVSDIKKWVKIQTDLESNNLNISKFYQGLVTPHFLKELNKKMTFIVKITFSDITKCITVAIGAPRNIVGHLWWLTLLWLYISDEEKEYGIFIDLPWKTKQLKKFFGKLACELKDNDWCPIQCYNEANNIKQKLHEIENNEKLHPKLKDLGKKSLLNSFITESKRMNMCLYKQGITVKDKKTLEFYQGNLKRVKKEKVTPGFYMDLLCFYGRVFGSYTHHVILIDGKYLRLKKSFDIVNKSYNPSNMTNDMIKALQIVNSEKQSMNVVNEIKAIGAIKSNSEILDNPINIENNISSISNQSSSRNLQMNTSNETCSNINLPHCSSSVEKPNCQTLVKSKNKQNKLLIRAARSIAAAFRSKLPHVVKVARELQKKIKNNSIKQAHIHHLNSLCQLEKKCMKERKRIQEFFDK